MMPTPHESTIYAELTEHTLLIARSRDACIDFFVELPLGKSSAIQEIFRALQPDWQDYGLRAHTALSPQPVYWHRSSLEEASAYRTEEALRQFGASLPHGLTDALELTACHAADGTLITPDGSARWLLGLAPETSLALARAHAAEWQIDPLSKESATLGHVGAIARALRLADRGSVVLWDLGADRSHLLFISPRGVDAVVPCSLGIGEILTAVQSVLKLSFRRAAAQMFYDGNFDFSVTGAKIVAQLAPALAGIRESLPAGEAVPLLASTGLTGKQSWFVREVAHVLGSKPWVPKIRGLCADFQLRFASPDIEASLSAASLGLMHLIGRREQGKSTWPAWCRAGITRLATAAPFFAPSLESDASVELTPTPNAESVSPPSPAPVTELASERPREPDPVPTPRSKPTLAPRKAPPPPSFIHTARASGAKPALAPKMPEETDTRLREEAHLYLCRQSLTEALEQLDRSKRQIEGTRPPFGVLGTKKARAHYEHSLRSTQETALDYRHRLQELAPIEHWLQSALQGLLHEYLGTASPEYHAYSETCVLVERWQNYVGEMHEFALGLARDARLTAALIGSRAQPGHIQQQPAVVSLRTITSHLHAQTIRIDLVNREIARLGESTRLAVALPPLPTFHHGTWVDRVILLNPHDRALELKRYEDAARAFCKNGKNDLLLRAESIRSTCLHARLEYLGNYWANLRLRVLEQCTDPLDVEHLLTELKQSYVSADLDLRRKMETNSPFSLAR